MGFKGIVFVQYFLQRERWWVGEIPYLGQAPFWARGVVIPIFPRYNRSIGDGACGRAKFPVFYTVT
jgi:hypothetical protein